MKNYIPFLACVCAGLMISGSPVYAQTKHHRPWFSSSHHHPSVVLGQAPAQGLPKTSSPVKGLQIIRQALHYQGAKYRFGGDTKKKGFDCSGLVKRVYNDLKIRNLPHTSSALYRMGKPVHLADLRPGDLLFFKNTYRPGISHVGVYAGHNRFIHARNRHHGVTLTSLSDPYFQLHYAGARRLY